MKTLLTGAMLCTLGAAAQVHESPEAWIAMPPRLDVPSISSEVSFASLSHDPAVLREGRNWRGRVDDGESWELLAGDDDHREGELGDLDRCAITAAPEPSTSALFALGAALMGFAARRTRRKR